MDSPNGKALFFNGLFAAPWATVSEIAPGRNKLLDGAAAGRSQGP
jgi:hypothetical protein